MQVARYSKSYRTGLVQLNGSGSTDKEKIHTHDFKVNDQEDGSHKTLILKLINSH